MLSCHTMLYRVIPCYTMLDHVIPCHTMLYHVILWIPCHHVIFPADLIVAQFDLVFFMEADGITERPPKKDYVTYHDRSLLIYIIIILVLPIEWYMTFWRYSTYIETQFPLKICKIKFWTNNCDFVNVRQRKFEHQKITWRHDKSGNCFKVVVKIILAPLSSHEEEFKTNLNKSELAKRLNLCLWCIIFFSAAIWGWWTHDPKDIYCLLYNVRVTRSLLDIAFSYGDLLPSFLFYISIDLNIQYNKTNDNYPSATGLVGHRHVKTDWKYFCFIGNCWKERVPFKFIAP